MGTSGLRQRFGAHIVNYADDLVICCRRQADEAMQAMRQLMTRLRLTVNEEKTRLCEVPQGYFNFLGYTFGRYYSVKTGKAYLGMRPSTPSIKRMVQAISLMTERRRTGGDAMELVSDLNSRLRGWANYFCLGPVSKSYRILDRHATSRLRRWLCMKHKAPSTARSCYHDVYLYKTLGLVRMRELTQSFPWAKP